MSDTQGVQLKPIARETLKLSVVGTAPLICHRWDEKAKGMMLDAQMGRKSPKEFKDPEAQYEASLYRLEDGSFGFPVVAFKAATVGAARYFDGVAMTELRRSLFFHGEGADQLVRIVGTPVMREDTVRVGRGVADLRYRGMFVDWSADLVITYLPSMLTLDSAVALVNAGGLSGVGEWRPGKCDSGMYGTYEVADQ